jgi:hypothetical protein
MTDETNDALVVARQDDTIARQYEIIALNDDIIARQDDIIERFTIQDALRKIELKDAREKVLRMQTYLDEERTIAGGKAEEDDHVTKAESDESKTNEKPTGSSSTNAAPQRQRLQPQADCATTRFDFNEERGVNTKMKELLDHVMNALQLNPVVRAGQNRTMVELAAKQVCGMTILLLTNPNFGRLVI